MGLLARQRLRSLASRNPPAFPRPEPRSNSALPRFPSIHNTPRCLRVASTRVYLFFLLPDNIRPMSLGPLPLCPRLHRGIRAGTGQVSDRHLRRNACEAKGHACLCPECQSSQGILELTAGQLRTTQPSLGGSFPGSPGEEVPWTSQQVPPLVCCQLTVWNLSTNDRGWGGPGCLGQGSSPLSGTPRLASP